jgi:hypothetical protein
LRVNSIRPMFPVMSVHRYGCSPPVPQTCA